MKTRGRLGFTSVHLGVSIAGGLFAMAVLTFSVWGRSEDTGDVLTRGGGRLEGKLDWSVPFANAVELPSVASAHIPFVPRVPSPALGEGATPTIFETDPSTTLTIGRQIVWAYNSPQFGQFFIYESLAPGPGTLAEWRNLADTKEGCHAVPATEYFGEGTSCHYGKDTLTTINGKTALISEGNNTTAVSWLEPFQPQGEQPPALEESLGGPPFVEVTIIGPSGEFTAGEARALATAF